MSSSHEQFIRASKERHRRLSLVDAAVAPEALATVEAARAATTEANTYSDGTEAAAPAKPKQSEEDAAAAGVAAANLT